MFPGLPNNEPPLTEFQALTDDQLDCYTVIFVLAIKAQRLCSFYLANKNFEKSKTVGLASWYYMGLSIKTQTRNNMLESAGLPTLHKTSLQILLQTFYEGLPNRNWERPQGNRL